MQASRGLSTAARALTAAVLLIVAGLALASGKPGQADPVTSLRPTIHGVNLPTGGFAPERLPGVHGTDYLFPERETGAPFLAMGMNAARVAFIWERLQPRPLGPLDPAELARLDRSVAALDGFAMVILDLHNYARYRGAVLDPADGSDRLLADVWRRLALHYKGSPKIAFGIMNEPHGLDAGTWRTVLDRTVTAIRATGARNLLLVSGTDWSGGHSWFDGGQRSNAAQLAGFANTDDNFVFEVHQYLDGNSSGQGTECRSKTAGRERLKAVTAWLRKERASAILGEFGVAPNPACLEALDDLLDYLDTNGDVWRGWVYWAGGDWWGSYPLSIQPDHSGDKPQVAVLRRHIAPAP
jgi:endoglucanase